MSRTVVTRFEVGVINSVRTTYSESGGVVDVNASNDLIELTGITVSPNSNWTLSLLIYPRHDGTLYNQTIYSQQNGTGIGRGWVSSPLVGQFFSCALGGVTRNSSKKPVINEWQWIVYSNENSGSTNILTMYHMMKGESNLIQIGQFSGITYENASGIHRFGAGKDDPTTGTGTRCFDGNISDIKFYTETLSHNQILQMCASNNYTKSNLFRHYKFSESSGLNIFDEMKSGDSAILMNGAAIDTSTIPFPIRTVVSRTVVQRMVV